MESYYLFFPFTDLKDLLLAEIEFHHPELRLSFSNKHFLSFKGPKGYQNQLKENPVVFSSRMGLFISKSDTDKENTVKVKEKEYWNYQIIKGILDTLEYNSPQLDSHAPARAWLKIAEAHELFKLNFRDSQQVIEIGSAPGGISYFLLNHGMKLFSIDPAKMNIEQCENFEHLKKSIFDVKREELPKYCDWIVSDLNLKGSVNVAEVVRISEFYPQLKGGFLTIKTPTKEDLAFLKKWKIPFKKRFSCQLFHLPSHRREIGLLFLKKERPAKSRPH